MGKIVLPYPNVGASTVGEALNSFVMWDITHLVKQTKETIDIRPTPKHQFTRPIEVSLQKSKDSQIIHS